MAYVSELDNFMHDLLKKKPELVELQKKNRATWWDKPQDLETNEERAESAVPQPGYVYFSPLRDEGDPV